MITLNNQKSIQQHAEVHRVSPDEKVWMRLEKKLIENKAARKVKWYKTALAASVTLLVISTVLLYNNNNNSSNRVNRLMGDIGDYKTEDLQITTGSTEIFYATDKIAELKQAYNKLGFNGKG